MEVYLRIDIDIVAMALLGAVLLIAHTRLDMEESLNKAYMRVSMCIVLQLLFEASTCIINRRQELVLIPISYILHVCLFITGPILSFYGYKLIRTLVFPNKEVLKRHDIMLTIPVAINTIITILSLKYHFIFYINKNNIYHRGAYFFLFSFIAYFYFVLSLVIIVRKRKQIVGQEFISLLLFAIFPMIGGTVQTIYYGPLLMWSSTAFSLVIIYVFLQQRMVHLDDLTGVWTRGSFDYYIKNCSRQKNNGKMGIIYCDIDDFKNINDQFGHMEGDLAIKNTTKIIKSAIRKNDIVARMGGDEFIILLENGILEALEETLDRIKRAFIQYNQESGKDYKLECSLGADILDLNHCSIEQFLHHIDCLMYENKRSKKENR